MSLLTNRIFFLFFLDMPLVCIRHIHNSNCNKKKVYSIVNALQSESFSYSLSLSFHLSILVCCSGWLSPFPFLPCGRLDFQRSGLCMSYNFTTITFTTSNNTHRLFNTNTCYATTQSTHIFIICTHIPAIQGSFFLTSTFLTQSVPPLPFFFFLCGSVSLLTHFRHHYHVVSLYDCFILCSIHNFLVRSNRFLCVCLSIREYTQFELHQCTKRKVMRFLHNPIVMRTYSYKVNRTKAIYLPYILPAHSDWALLAIHIFNVTVAVIKNVFTVR